MPFSGQLRVGRGGPDGSLIDPGPQQRDLFFGQRCSLAFGRHSLVITQTGDPQYQRAGTALPRDNRLAVLSPLKRLPAVVQTEVAFLLFGTVAGETFRLKNRLNLPGEVDLPVAGRGLLACRFAGST